MRRRPNALTVASCFGESPMMLRTSVSLSFFCATHGLLLSHVTVGPPPGRMEILQTLDPPERVDRRLQHVVRIVRAERLRQDVLDTGRFQHWTNRAAGHDPGARHGGLQ